MWDDEQWMAYVSMSRACQIKSLLPNETSVGLRVTSLKWTGPDPEGSETLPTVPSQIEYTDEVSRADDIGFGEEPSDLRRIEAGNGVDSDDHLALDRSLTYHDDSSFQETTQDIADRRKLQNMMQVGAPES